MSKIRNYPTSGVRSGRVLFRYNEIELYPRAELHIFSKQHYSQNHVNGGRTLVSETPYPHINTDKYLHIHRFKKLILASIYPKEMLTVLAIYIIIKRVDIPPLVFPVCRSSPKHPHFALPESSYNAPAASGMVIREQTWILTHITFRLNSQQPNNTTIAKRNKSLQFNRHRTLR